MLERWAAFSKAVDVRDRGFRGERGLSVVELDNPGRGEATEHSILKSAYEIWAIRILVSPRTGLGAANTTPGLLTLFAWTQHPCQIQAKPSLTYRWMEQLPHTRLNFRGRCGGNVDIYFN